MEQLDKSCWTKEIQRITRQEHGIPELGNLEHRITLSASVPAPIHYHSDLVEICCLIKGTRTSFVFEHDMLQPYSVSGNEAIVLYPFELHSNGMDPQKPCEYYGFQLCVKDPDHILCLDPAYSRMLYRQLFALKNRRVCLSSAEMQLLRSAFQLLLFSERTEAQVATGIQFLSCFLFHLCFALPNAEKTPDRVDARIQAALDYIRDNLTEALSVETLAQAAGLSVSRFKTVFKEEIGYPPSEYITAQKIEAAKHMLESTDIGITELAYQLGFSSGNYFATVFRKIMGCTPREYRTQFASQGGQKQR